MLIFQLILSLAGGYLLGSFNTALVVGRLYGVDLKKKGSKNAGLTNTLRVLGPGAAGMVLFGDILKGVLACLLGYLLTKGSVGSERFIDLTNENLGMLLAGTSCIIGHIFPIYFNFKGGKGVLTSVTIVSLLDFRIAAILLCIFIIILLLSRYVSLGSIIAAICFPIVSILFDKPMYFMFYSIVIAVLILIMHRKNIGRLMDGTESKLKIKT